MKSYRKIYEEFYNIKIPNGYEIHHIDFNHSNNDIKNLVMLPKELHKDLHYYYNEFERSKQNYTLEDITVFSGEVNSKSFFMFNLINYCEVLKKCVFWMNQRDDALIRGKQHIS